MAGSPLASCVVTPPAELRSSWEAGLARSPTPHGGAGTAPSAPHVLFLFKDGCFTCVVFGLRHTDLVQHRSYLREAQPGCFLQKLGHSCSVLGTRDGTSAHAGGPFYNKKHKHAERELSEAWRESTLQWELTGRCHLPPAHRARALGLSSSPFCHVHE